MLQQRVLTIEEYARERRNGKKLSIKARMARFGSRFAPIPVVAPGETEAQYENAFQAFIRESQHRTLEEIRRDGNVDKERIPRFLFANKRADLYSAQRQASSQDKELHPPTTLSPARPPVVELDVNESSSTAASSRLVREHVPREALYVTRCIELDEYKTQVRNGLFKTLAGMNVAEREREFGSQILPIYVPLARGETIVQYEEQFTKWLWKTKRLTLVDLESHPKETEERFYRKKFASVNARGGEAGDDPFSGSSSYRELPVERERRQERRPPPNEDDPPPPKKHKQSTKEMQQVEKAVSRRVGRCAGQATIPDCIQCGCRRCLVGGMRALAAKMQPPHSSIHTKGSSTFVVDLAGVPGTTTDSTTTTTITSIGTEDHDAMEAELVNEYDAINDQIVMNENELEASSMRLARMSVVAEIDETTRVQDEDREMRELIQQVVKTRTEALAPVVLLMWSHAIGELQRMVDDPTATHVPFIQRRCHHTCAQLASEIAEKRDHVAQLDTQLDLIVATESNGVEQARKRMPLLATRTRVKSEQRVLLTQRRRQFAVLVHFDQRLRRLVQALLDHVSLEKCKLSSVHVQY